MDLETAGPLVLDTLTRACSQSPDVLRPAEHQLHQWETVPGFYAILSTIFCNHEIDVNVRWLAVLYTKNGVDRYWRKSAPHAISEEEKEGIRQHLVANFGEPSAQVCTQLAVLVAKIARLDCPRNWPALLPALLPSVRCPDPLLQGRSTLVLHHVVKTLASKRLTQDRKLFEDLTKDIFGYLYGLWLDQLAEFLHLASQHSDDTTASADRTLLSLRVLRRLATFGFREPSDSQVVMSFFNTVFTKLDAVLECRQSLWGRHKLLEKIEKLIILMTKVLLDTLEQHPVCYMQFIQRTLEMVVRYNFTQTGLLFERFTVNCFNLMKNILLCDTYRPGKHEVEPDSTKLQAHKIKMSFFTYSTLGEICRRLISQYFLLSSEELSTWDTDPEAFCQEEIGDSYKFSLRPCTESLFMGLFKEFRMSLSTVLLEMVQDTYGPCDVDDMAAILRKDAVYNAVGLAAYDLFDDVHFDQWFSTQLVRELQVQHVNYRVVRRRVVWLAGQWVGVRMSASLRPALYRALLPLLGPPEDLVVRLEAAHTLKLAVDDFEFNVDQFLPFLNTSFSMLFQLLKEVRECDSKMQVLHVISFVIERVGDQIRPYATSLIAYLPELWRESEEHNMLRCAILTTLIHLVQGFGCGSTAMYDFLLPVIQLSTDTRKPEHVYLAEDGLELWHCTLIHCPAFTPALLDLYRNMADLLGTEHLRICLKVIESYLLLGPREFMERYSKDLVASFSSVVTEIRTEGLVLVLRVLWYYMKDNDFKKATVWMDWSEFDFLIIELVFNSFPSEGPDVFRNMLPGFLSEILNKDEHPVVMSMYLTLFGRILLQNPDFFWLFLDQAASAAHTEVNGLLQSLLVVWLDSLDSMTQPERRKLTALALASLLPLNSSVILDNFGGIVTLCVQVLHDVCRVPVDEETEIQMDRLQRPMFANSVDPDEPARSELSHQELHSFALVISGSDDIQKDDQESEHDKRKRILTRQDPVHTIALKDHVFQQLAQCQQVHGQPTFHRLIEQIDPEIFNQLQQFSKAV